MKKALLTTCVLAISLFSFSQPWNYPWAFGVGSPEDDDSSVRIDVDSEDNTYMTFEYEGALSVAGTDYPAPADNGRDVLVVKLNPSGEVLWSGSIAGDGVGNVLLSGDLVNAIHVDSDDNVIVIGNVGPNGTVFGVSNGLTEQRNFIIKINPEGSVLWEVYANDDYLNEELTAVNTDGEGNIYVVGLAPSSVVNPYVFGGVTISDPSTNSRYGMIKLAQNGSVEFIEALPTGKPTRIEPDANGDYLISSQYGESDVTDYALHKISASDFSTIWFRENIGGAQDTPRGGNLGFHVKADNSIVQFLKTTQNIEYPDAGTADCDEFCSMGVLVNIDADGNTVSTHTMEAIIDNPLSIGLLGLNFFPTAFEAIDDETFYIAGRHSDDVQFSNGFLFQPSESYLGDFDNPEDAFVVKVDGSLNLLEYASQTGSAEQGGVSLAVFSNGDAALGGIYEIESFGGFTGNTVFGEDELPGFGGEDYFAARVVTGTEAPVGVETIADIQSFKQFPVPANNVLNIGFDNISTGDTRIEIRDISGRLLISERQVKTGNVQMAINVSDLNPGIYFTTILTGSSTLSQPFTVVR